MRRELLQHTGRVLLLVGSNNLLVHFIALLSFKRLVYDVRPKHAVVQRAVDLFVVDSVLVFQARVELAVVVLSRGIVRVFKPFLYLRFFHQKVVA